MLNKNFIKNFILGFFFTFIIAAGFFYAFPEFGLNQNNSPALNPSGNNPKSSVFEDINNSNIKQEDKQTTELKESPNKKVLRGGKQVYQTFNNCGPASLSMLLSHYDINVTQAQLGDELRPYQNQQGDNDDKSVTLTELGLKAEEYGFVTYMRPLGDINMIQNFITYDIPVITRTWLNPKEDIGHYRVVKGYNKNKGTIIQDDSYQGKNISFKYDDFNELWQAFNYEFLVIVPEDKEEIAEQILGHRLNKNTAWESALNSAEIRSENNPNDVYAKFNQLVAHYYLGNYEEAVEIFEQTQNNLPKRMLWYQIEPILAYYKLGNYDKVLNLTQSVFDSQNRSFSELHYLRGKIYEKRNQPNLAEKEYSLAENYNTSDYWKSNLDSIEN